MGTCLEHEAWCRLLPPPALCRPSRGLHRRRRDWVWWVPGSCFSTCQAAAFASTTTCTYTHVTTGIFLSGSQTITKTCAECYPAGSTASTAVTSLSTAISNAITSLTTLLG